MSSLALKTRAFKNQGTRQSGLGYGENLFSARSDENGPGRHRAMLSEPEYSVALPVLWNSLYALNGQLRLILGRSNLTLDPRNTHFWPVVEKIGSGDSGVCPQSLQAGIFLETSLDSCTIAQMSTCMSTTGVVFKDNIRFLSCVFLLIITDNKMDGSQSMLSRPGILSHAALRLQCATLQSV
jgi:hypothetical protein